MSLIAGAIAGGVGLASSIGNFFSGKNTNKSNQRLAAQQNEYNLQYQQNEFAQNEKQSELEYQRNLEMWNMQNEYNSPYAQMQRYQQAGLNPNLIYGTGSASAGNAGSSPTFTAARYKAPSAERAQLSAPSVQFDPYQAIQIGQALALQKAQTDSIKAQTSFTQEQAKNAQVDNLLKAETLTGKKLSNEYLPHLLRHEVMNKDHQGRLLHSQTRSTSLDADLKHQLWQLNEKLNPYKKEKLIQEINNLKQTYDVEGFKQRLRELGISDRDNAILRFASRLLIANEDSIDAFIQTILK